MRIEHAALYTADLEAMRKFFAAYFNASASPMYHNPRTTFSSYFLTFPDGGARLEIMTCDDLSKTVPADKCTGLNHLCLSVGSKEAVDSCTQRLQHDGYQLLSGPRTTGDGYYESKFFVPDGLFLEITV